MTLGDQRAFPHEYKEPGNIRVVQEGMTYRQWLVGQIAGGASPTLWEMEYDHAVDTILNRADAIIKRLEANE